MQKGKQNLIKVIKGRKKVCEKNLLKIKKALSIESPMPLTSLMPCQKGKIAFIKGDEKIVKRLSDLGLTPKSEILIVRKSTMNGPVEVFVRKTNLAIASEIARDIFVFGIF